MCTTVTRNKKSGKVTLNIKKDKAWYPVSKSDEIKHKQMIKDKSWKKNSKIFQEASEQWENLSKKSKQDYILRKIGEEEALAFIKSKQPGKKFIPKSPYAAFMNSKVSYDKLYEF